MTAVMEPAVAAEAPLSVGIDESYDLIERYTAEIEEHRARIIDRADEIVRLRRHVAILIAERDSRIGGTVETATKLSHAEQRVAAYIRSPLSNGEIAREMHLSIDTVKTHLKRIYAKLGVAGRSQAAAVMSIRASRGGEAG